MNMGKPHIGRLPILVESRRFLCVCNMLRIARRMTTSLLMISIVAIGLSLNDLPNVHGITAETEATPIPTPPRNLTAVAGIRTFYKFPGPFVELKWKAPASDGGDRIIGFNIYRGNNSGAETFLSFWNMTEWNITVYSNSSFDTYDNDVVFQHTYFYKVTATNSLGESGYSNEVKATVPRPRDSIPPMPIILLTMLIAPAIITLRRRRLRTEPKNPR